MGQQVNGVWYPSHNVSSFPVTSTATLFSAARQGRILFCQPTGSVDIWIGGPGVAVGTGILLSHSSTPPTFFIDTKTSADWWAIAASVTTLYVDQIF